MPPRARHRRQRGQGQLPPVPAQPPQPPPPDPTQGIRVFELDVSLDGAAGYTQLQNERDQRCNQLSAIHFNGTPMTTSDNSSYHLVQLTHADYQQRVQLLFRDRDQYLLAFQRGDGRWFRFLDLEVPGLNAEILNLPSSHGSMLRRTKC
uniref:rRNA N-glycosidase n=1 Tax=Oryza punctata TaxID=4537 RepID=A0A0E0LKS1_ORYPU